MTATDTVVARARKIATNGGAMHVQTVLDEATFTASPKA